ncbi:MAG: rhodanese-like domain-containing protein [Myxococcota bacterium]
MPLSDLSNPDVLLRENWQNHLRHGADGTPILPPAFVAEAGARVWIVDIRDDDELTGPQGHIPGVWRMPLERIGEVRRMLPGNTPVLLVCDTGFRSRTAARFLVSLGMTTVAAMEGGMVHWQSSGYAVSRATDVGDRFLSIPSPGHGSDGRLLNADRRGERRLTREQIVDHVGDISKVRRVKLAAFLLASQTSCVDGREDRAIIGTPGGDSGELLLSLAAAEQISGTHVELANIPALTRLWADTFGGIYLHTDNHALNALARSLRTDPRLEPAVAGLSKVADWEGFLRHPPEHLREPLLEHLTQPDHVGCGHIKLALKNPGVYDIRPDLIIAFFRAFYTAMWGGAHDLSWVVLGGDHAEGAVVNVTLEDELSPFAEIPMIAPSIGGVQMFVNHPQVVTYLRTQSARFLAQRAGHLLPAAATQDALAKVIPELGGAQALATLKALAAGLPVFDVHFGRDGECTVTQGDPIPSV